MRGATTLALGAALCAAIAVPAEAAATKTAGYWPMDEPADSSTLVDASGNGLDGTIGLDVVHGADSGGQLAHTFPFVLPDSPPMHPEHLDRVADSDRIDPGTRDYAVTIRARWTVDTGNILQKGQTGTKGGFWKLENPGGKPTCLFRDGTNRTRTAVAKRPMNDGAWHVIRCERNRSGTYLWIDGAAQYQATGTTGSIANTWGLTIGGKGSCDQITVGCDYWVGDIDYVRIETS